MKERIAKYLRNASLKERKSVIERTLLVLFAMYKKLRNILANSDSRTLSKLYLRTKSLERNIMGGEYSFVTVDELLIWTTEWIKSFPTTYDVIVGIPRSGLLVANLVALKLGKPLSTPELFIQGRYWKSTLIDKKGEYEKILLVDDSITGGKTMEESVQLLQTCRGNLNITKAVLMATKDSKDFVDLYYRIIQHPRIFEWNLLHAKKGKLATDLDGVICENCPPGVDSDEKLYTAWIKSAKQYLIPAFEIDVIVSNRLEKYRSDTEKWLYKHGVRYKELILWDIQSKKERDGKQAQRKTEVLLKIKPDIFWESCMGEAKQIWKATKIPTLCIDEMIFLG